MECRVLLSQRRKPRDSETIGPVWCQCRYRGQGQLVNCASIRPKGEVTNVLEQFPDMLTGVCRAGASYFLEPFSSEGTNVWSKLSTVLIGEGGGGVRGGSQGCILGMYIVTMYIQ